MNSGKKNWGKYMVCRGYTHTSEVPPILQAGRKDLDPAGA